MAKAVIRSLQEEDVESVQEMLSCFPETYPYTYVHGTKLGGLAWLFRHILEHNDPFEAGSFVLELGEEVIGHVAYMRDVHCSEDGVYYATAFAVDKRYQGRGYGKKLISHLERELKKIGARIVWFQTEMEKLRYYRPFRFKQVGLFYHYWGPGVDRYALARYFVPTEKK